MVCYFSGRSLTIATVLATTALVGCGLTPSDGPSAVMVEDRAVVSLADAGHLSYALVKLTPLVVSLTKRQIRPPLFSRSATASRFKEVRFEVGDTISVAVFEAGAGGLFIPSQAGSRPGNFSTLR